MITSNLSNASGAATFLALQMLAEGGGGSGGAFEPFPDTWPVSDASTTAAFCAAVNADDTAVQGNCYLGEVRWSDLPASMANAEIVCEIMAGTGTADKVIHLICTSGNRAPYRWEYTYWNNGSNTSGWIGFQNAITAQTISTAGDVTQALDAGVIYHFTGALMSLTITLNAATAPAQYHFDFVSGATPTVLIVPNTVTMPDDF